MEQLIKSMMGLPRWVQAWLLVLFGTNMASLAFLDHEIGLYTATVFGFICAFNMPMMVMQRGMTRLLAVPHFAWVPLLAYLGMMLWGHQPLPASPIRTYAISVFVLNAISLGFDLVDATKWFLGQREVLGLRTGR